MVPTMTQTRSVRSAGRMLSMSAMSKTADAAVERVVERLAVGVGRVLRARPRSGGGWCWWAPARGRPGTLSRCSCAPPRGWRAPRRWSCRRRWAGAGRRRARFRGRAHGDTWARGRADHAPPPGTPPQDRPSAGPAPGSAPARPGCWFWKVLSSMVMRCSFSKRAVSVMLSGLTTQGALRRIASEASRRQEFATREILRWCLAVANVQDGPAQNDNPIPLSPRLEVIRDLLERDARAGAASRRTGGSFRRRSPSARRTAGARPARCAVSTLPPAGRLSPRMPL